MDALIAFESVTRTGGMTAAARELGVTQSAVSHRIRRLEDFMEVELFQRSGRGLSLTPAGAALQDSVSKLLGAAAQLKARVTAAQAPGRLRLGVGSALADNWLVRRLPDFASRHPEVTLELMVVENEAPERRANLDVRILWVAASEARPTSTQRPLFREHVFPVCSPKLLPEGYQPGDPAILKKLPLLHKIVHGVASGAE